jgi:hypothetical protein
MSSNHIEHKLRKLNDGITDLGSLKLILKLENIKLWIPLNLRMSEPDYLQLPKFASQTSNEKSVMSLQKGEIYTDILT